MAIPLSDFQNLRFIRIREGATMSRSDEARFDSQPYGGSNIRAWRQPPQSGYNSSFPRTSPLRINLNNDSMSLPPGAR